MSFNGSFYALFTGVCLLLLSSCAFFDESESQRSTSISGTVVHSNTGQPVNEAIVQITQPQFIQQSTVTDADGLFVINDLAIDTDVDVTLQVSKPDFTTQYRQLSVSSGSEIDAGTVTLQEVTNGNDDNNNNGGNNNDNGNESDESGGAAAIILAQISRDAINIQETGGEVHSEISFVAQDSTGRSLTAGRSQTVYLEIVSGPDGGEAITPNTAQTDENGMVKANLVSGYTAGVVKVEARIERDDIGLTIRSKPIAVAIHGGYPEQNHFSISLQTRNFEGLNIDGIENRVSVVVGDKFSNPVKPGTPVYFKTSGGVIQGSGTTDIDGRTSVNLISGNPRPANGYAEITAQTYDENDNLIEVSIPVLFSGSPSASNINITPDEFNIPAGGGRTYTLTLTDENQNPLPAGTSVTVELESEILTLSGDTEFQIPNALYAGGGVTEFNFAVRDNDDDNIDAQEYDITVRVSTPEGFTAQRTFSD